MMSEIMIKQKKHVVLVADDSSTVRKFVSFSLYAENLDVITAEDGMDALEKLSQAPELDLIIVDLNMPNMDGFEFIENVRRSEVYGDVPIIILSSERSAQSKQRGVVVGANAYLEKPFDATEIKYHVSKFLNVDCVGE